MKIKILVLTLFTCFMISSMSFAGEILVSINDQLVNHEDFVIYDSGVTYGLLAEFANKMNVELIWLSSAKLAVLNIDGEYVSFKKDSKIMIVNNKNYEMTNAAISRNGRIYVPLDVLTEKLGMEYAWDSDLLHVELSNEKIVVDQNDVRNVNYTPEDLLWLARIVNVEARGGTVDKKIAVANVVLNRVNSFSFPNTIYDVLYQKGQFPPAYYSYFASSEPVESSFIAAKRALMGVSLVESCLYFNNRPFTSKADSFYKLIEGDYFYY